MDKLEWLKWATEQEILKQQGQEYLYWTDENGIIYAEALDDEVTIARGIWFFIEDEIDKRGWFLSQIDAKVYSDYECTQYEGREYHAVISRLAPAEENSVIGKGESKDSRLEALLEAFKMAVSSAT